jgi:GDP-L-fucose synthase
MNPQSRIFVAGHRGLVGSSLVRKLRSEGYDPLVRTHAELDLLDQRATHAFFRDEKVEYVFVAAGLVGGIYANSTRQADFLYDNVMIAANVLHAAFEAETEKVLFLGSSCIYPRLAPQPIPEAALLTGPLEPTNEGYALAKIVGLKLCELFQRQYRRRFISAMPTNLYGPGDNFDPLGAHVIPAMMRRFHEAKLSEAPEVLVWGTGSPRREFLYVDDLTEALLLLMRQYEDPETINVGTGQEVTIRELAETMAAVVGYPGELKWDATKPDGMPRKLLDSSRIQALGWTPQRELEEALASTYEWALAANVFEQPLVTSRERRVVR